RAILAAPLAPMRTHAGGAGGCRSHVVWAGHRIVEVVLMPRLEVGARAPEFSLPAADGSTVTLGELLPQAQNGVIVYFNPAASTLGCTIWPYVFLASLASLASAGYTVVGISPDGVNKLEKFANNQSLTFPLLSDPEHNTLEAYGAWGEKKNYGRTSVGVIRSTVVVDPDGNVALAQYNVKATGHVARLRRDLGLD